MIEIKIENIYYMLTYFFVELKEKRYDIDKTVDFESVADLLSRILIKALSKQIKRGLERDYIEETNELSTLRGRIDIATSINTLIRSNHLICSYDEYSINSYKNQIIKTTLNILLKKDINKNRKNKIKTLLLYLKDVDILDSRKIDWKNIQYNHNNQTYKLIIGMCYLIINGLLPLNNEDASKILNLNPKHMYYLYEKFILEYYKQEHKEVITMASKIEWQVDDSYSKMLPIMKTDITLTKENKILIIDTKYYDNILSKNNIQSNHLYQIFAYVKNKQVEKGLNSEVSGMLLYAGTDEKEQPNQKYIMNGNVIYVKTLNLNDEFSKIREQLDNIVDEM